MNYGQLGHWHLESFEPQQDQGSRWSNVGVTSQGQWEFLIEVNESSQGPKTFMASVNEHSKTTKTWYTNSGVS